MLCIVQARSSSKRLPDKIFKKIAGKSVIERVLIRLKKSKEITKIVFATSNRNDDNRVENFCLNNKIICYRGDLNNVALRYFNILKQYNNKSFLRISCDSPFLDYNLIDKAIKIYGKKKVDLVTNIFPRSFPKGQSIEILNSNIFKSNFTKFTLNQKEHVTKYFYDNYKKFKIFNIKSFKNKSFINLAIDTKKEFIYLNDNFKKINLK